MEVRTQRSAANRMDPERKDLAVLIDERRATNHFTPEEVRPEDIEEILHAASRAPSGYNLQPWRFIVVRKPENKKRLQEAAFDQEKISEASVVIIFLGMREQTKAWAHDVFAEGNRRGLGKPETNDDIIRGATAFISNLGWDLWLNRHVMIAFSFAMLMAESLGYDTAPMEGFDADAVRREFSIPRDGQVIALLAIGKGKEPDKKFPGRFPLNRIAFSEQFGKPWTHEAPGNLPSR